MVDLLIVTLVVASVALWLGRRWWRAAKGQGAGCGCGCGEGGCGAGGDFQQVRTCRRFGDTAENKEKES
ncbi:MAG: FeoB-associated Cys-rich membrane protein [Desulfarculaceae bacterium]|nr:FeoB-associated Cys-rich membrane protein [Desulfarculaceae bacterium]MCF8048944.1 FeoB-associated Cys-rich membrane protein [Desulfarculaceae bacterium]MCF8066546.1 FeoB-associated Cys-rich membrane protein [Desulfarculaceae bacterium]MCF8098219.1 FeoB-associated Cys-rich membrane protein [Desulfarculaceae bacterium]MCF8124428.1 FeoB-associated Cys-rich membrane protein [Desulfarculaceae bacterium]